MCLPGVRSRPGRETVVLGPFSVPLRSWLGLQDLTCGSRASDPDPSYLHPSPYTPVDERRDDLFPSPPDTWYTPIPPLPIFVTRGSSPGCRVENPRVLSLEFRKDTTGVRRGRGVRPRTHGRLRVNLRGPVRPVEIFSTLNRRSTTYEIPTPI